MDHPKLTDADAARLRDALVVADYTVDAVSNLLGPIAAAALHRNEATPGLRATTGGSRLETLTRLWPLQAAVPSAAAAAVLPIEPLIAAGILMRDGEEVRARVDIRPYADDAGDWWVCSDLTPGMDGRLDPVPDDHVLGLNAASSTLAQLTVRRPMRRALDLGTGCGVQALHLSRHCESVVATDVNPRAIALARVTAQLNELEVDLRPGSLYEPVTDERFDLIVSNPPFVVSPGGGHVYRDSGLPGDEVSRRVMADGAALLSQGGLLQALGNWVHRRGEDWQQRLGSWLRDTECDAWVIEREIQDPAEYVELWLRDSGDVMRPDYRERYDAWLSWFEAQQVEGIGFGWVMLRASGSSDPDVRVESWSHAVEQPLGDTVAAHFTRVDALHGRTPGADLLETTLTVAPDVVMEQLGEPGAEHPARLVLRQQRGMRRATEVDTATAGLVGACEGSLPVGSVIDALATVLEVPASPLRDELVPRVRELVAEGFLEPRT